LLQRKVSFVSFHLTRICLPANEIFKSCKERAIIILEFLHPCVVEMKERCHPLLRKYRRLLILIFFLILYVLVLTVYLLGESLLAQHGLEYRAGISSLGFFWIYLLPFPAGGVLLVC